MAASPGRAAAEQSAAENAESAAELRRNVEQREAELREAKERLLARQEAEKNAKKDQFEKRALEAKEQIANARGDRSRVREQIAEAYRAQAEQERESTAISDQLWHVQLERVTEEVLFKKMRLEKAAAKRSELYEEQREKEEQLSTLNEELSRRDVNSEAMLQDALQRADVLREALKELEEDGSDLHQQWLKAYRAKDDPDDSNGKDFSLLDELMAQRQQRQRKKARDAAAKLRDLNDERFRLSQQRREAIQRRKELEMLAAKGPEFLAEIELGEGPPVDFVKLNLSYQSTAEEGAVENEIEQEADAGDEELDDMVGRLKAGLDTALQEVAVLKRAVAVMPTPERLPDTPAAAVLRDLNLPPSHPQASLPGSRLHWTVPPRTVETTSEARDCATALVDDLVETAWRQVYIFVPQQETVEQEQQWWKTQGKSLQKEVKRRQLANIAWVVLNELVEEVVVATVEEIDKDIGALGGLSRQFGDDILLSSIRNVCQSSDSSRVTSAHDELVRQRSTGESKHGMTVTWWAPPQGPAMPRPRKPVLKPWDADARKLKHGPVPSDSKAAPWDELLRGLQATRSGMIGQEISGKAAISCMKLNAQGSLICIGRTNGEILVFTCPSAASGRPGQGQVDPILLRKHAPVSSADGDLIVEIGWSVDSTQLYTINHKGLVVLWSMQVNPETKASKVKKLWRVAQLDESALQAPRTELDLARNDTTVPNTACFHPGLTLMGSQPGIVLGTTGGDVLKCTASASAGAKLLNSEDLSSECGVQLNNVAPGTSDGKSNKNDKSGTVGLRPHYTVKETFSAHKSKVIAVDFGPGDTLVTLDSTGKVLRWPYQRDQFTGFGWFHPDKSCLLGLDRSFAPIGDQQNIFPVSGSSVSVNPALDPRYLQRVKAASEAVASLKDLAVAPCAHSTTASGSLQLTYPPKEVSGSFADCTVLEYGVSGAGAGLLLRHATQRCEVSAASRGAVAPKGPNHMSFSPCRTKLYFLVSEDTAAGSKLVVVGLRTDRMSWLPIRVNAGSAQPNSIPALCVHSMAGLRASEFAYVLNSGEVGMYCLQSGQKLQTVDNAGWGTMSATALGSKIALSRSGGSPEVWFMELKSEGLQAAEHVIDHLLSGLRV
jgi:hypothetical protein